MAFIFHSINIREKLPAYAEQMSVSTDDLVEALEEMLADEQVWERTRKGASEFFISYIDLSSQLEDPLKRDFYILLKSEVPCEFQPKFGINWPTFKNRFLRCWEQTYNIIINKIPFHCVRLAWLRLGGMKIGKGSSVWRHTEVIGIENIVIGEDSVVGWHCQLDGRTGIIIGDHVTIASHVLIIAGAHDFLSKKFTATGYPIYIEDYAWIASRAIITAPGKVARGSVVGAGTVVNKALEAHKIYGGFNAKPIGDRPQDLDYKVGGKSLYTFLH